MSLKKNLKDVQRYPAQSAKESSGAQDMQELVGQAEHLDVEVNGVAARMRPGPKQFKR